jgi:hypothetical protein
LGPSKAQNPKKPADSARNSVPSNLTHHVEKIFGNQTGPSKSDRDDLRDSRNRLQEQTKTSPRKDWEETIESVDMTLTVSEKPKAKPPKLQPKVVKQATVDFERDDYEDDEFDSFSMSKSAASTKLNQHKRYSSNMSQDEITCFQCYAKFPADQAGLHRLKCLKQARIEEREDDSDEKYTSVEKSIEKSDTLNKVGKVKLEVKENIGGKPAKNES